MANHWLSHVKKTMKAMKSKGTYHKGDGLKKVIKEAKKTYHKKRGGMEEVPGSEGGRRTRRHRKSRR